MVQPSPPSHPSLELNVRHLGLRLHRERQEQQSSS